MLKSPAQISMKVCVLEKCLLKAFVEVNIVKAEDKK